MSSSGKTFLAIQPNSYPETVINCNDFSLVEATDFEKVTIQNETGYLTMDPRTYNSPRNQYLLLDTPPLTLKNTQPLTNIYGSENNVQTGFYPSYGEIKGGSIIYYNDISSDLPYTKPNYEIQALMKPSILKDPMGQTSTIYQRIPIPAESTSISDYSFDQDQMEFREDLLSLQSQSMNKNNYTSYHFFKNL